MKVVCRKRLRRRVFGTMRLNRHDEKPGTVRVNTGWLMKLQRSPVNGHVKSMRPSPFSKHPLRNIPGSITFPAVLSVILFVMTIFMLVLPYMESALMARKREQIHDLTQIAWHTLTLYADRARAGDLPLSEAQRLAAEHLRHLRYGADAKDYFWINDMCPRIVMHPYRPDLEGRDVSDFSDPQGKRLFVEFVETVRREGAGFVNYQWQWQDDPGRIVPKISYVKGFQPWGWVVGTGIYTEDVRGEISTITHRLTWMCLGILGTVILLSGLIVWQGMRVERERRKAEEQFRVQQEQLFQAAKMASVGTLVSGVAHEINNPTTSILLNAPLLATVWERMMATAETGSCIGPDFQVQGLSLPDLQERIPRLLRGIEDSALRIRSIVTDLKDFARQSPSELSDDVNLSVAAEKASRLVANLVQKATDGFSIDLKPDLPMFRGNLQRVEQVIINLIVNASQARNPGERLEIALRTGFDDASRSVFVEVKDSGTGISPEMADQVTDPFFTTRRTEGGTGLGLAISARIISDHGGTLDFIPNPGGGTTARVTFPLEPV